MTVRGRKNSASGIRGVHYEGDRDRWCAEIRVTIRAKVHRERQRFEGTLKGKIAAAAWITARRKQLGIVDE